MLYKLTININKEYNFEKLDILDFFSHLKKSFNILNKEYIFFDNNINFNTYNPKILNCFIEYIISSDNKDIETYIDAFLKNYNFITDYIFSKLDDNFEMKNEFSINCSQITNLVNNIDKLFYLRKDLQEMGKYISEDMKKDYYKLIKNLSLTKYELKNKAFNLRLLNVAIDLKKIETSLIDYAKNFGIDLQFDHTTSDTFIDKIVYFNIKTSLINLLHNFIKKNYKLQQKNIHKTSFKLGVYFTQTFNKLKIIIKSDTIFENEENFFNYKTCITSNGGRTFINEENDIISKIPLNFLTLDCYIISSELGYFAIDKTQILKIYNYLKENKINIGNKEYYNLNNFKFPILNKSKNPKYALHIYIKKQNFIFLVDDILYEEKVFVQPIEFDNIHFIGECLLKDTKKAYILNLKTYL